MFHPRITIVTPGTFPAPSPKSSSVEQAVDEACRQISDQADVIVFSRRKKGFPYKQTIQGVRHVRPRFRKKSAYLMKCHAYIKKNRPDVIQVDNRPRYARYFKKRYPHVPLILSLHSTTFIRQPHIRLAELRRCLKAVDRLVVNSRFLQSKLESMLPEISSKIRVNHLGTDPEKFTPKWSREGSQARSRLCNQLGYLDKKIILYLGRLQKNKGIHRLLEVFPEVVREHPDAVLVIVGSAYYGNNRVTPYVKSLHRLGNRFPANVRFIPFVPHSQVWEWYCLAEVVVVPSCGEEAFGLVNVEAMASGVPVVASDNGGIGEVVEDAKTGLLTEVDQPGQMVEALSSLLQDDAQRRRMGEAGRERVESQFTWQHVSQRWFDIIQETINS